MASGQVDVPVFHPFRLTADTQRRNRQRPDSWSVSERRRKAMMLREAGVETLQIGYQLHADPQVNLDKVGTPSGYGWWLYQHGKPPLRDAKLVRAVNADIDRVLRDTRLNEAEESQRQFHMTLRRLERLYQASYPLAVNGSQWHIFRCLQIEERRAKMWGWDTEKRVVDANVSGAVGVIPAKVPEYTPQYVGEMFDVLLAAGLVEGEEVEALTNAFQSMEPEVTVDSDVVDAEVIEEPDPFEE